MQRARVLLAAADVVVVGGGPTGAALGCALASHPSTKHLRVALLDERPHRPTPLRDVPDVRVLALSPASVQLLQSCGVWDGVVARRASPYYSMHVLDASGSGGVRFTHSDAGLPLLGIVVEHSVLCDALYARLDTLPVARLPCGPFTTRAALQEHVEGDDWLLVGCDGLASAVRQSMRGVCVQGASYGQRAVCAALKVEDADFFASSALQRFTPEGGCVALLPAPAGFLNLVVRVPSHTTLLCSLWFHWQYSVPAAVAPALLALDGSSLAAAVTRAAGPALLSDMPAIVGTAGPSAAFPLRWQRASHYVDPSQKAAIVGDAAHGVHPLAGQGYNMALADVSVLVHQLAGALECGSPLVHGLAAYEAAARPRNTAALAAVHALWSAMQGAGLVGSALRALGMNAVSAAPPLRRLLVEQAVGSSLMANNTWQ